MFKPNCIFIVFISIILGFSCVPDVEKKVSPFCASPDGRIVVSLHKDIDLDTWLFTVLLDKDTVIHNSSLGISLVEENSRFIKQLHYEGFKSEIIEEVYTMPTGKQSRRLNHCTEGKYKFTNNWGSPITIVFRVFNDGVAFKYILENESTSRVTKEVSVYNISDIANVWSIPFSTGEEHIFENTSGPSLPKGPLSFPVLLESGTGNWFLVSESDVSNYPLSGGSFEDGLLRYLFPGEEESINQVSPGFQSPWRVIIMGSDLDAIVESCIIDHLSPPSVLKDESWIESGVAAFPWWGDNYANSYPDALKKYIDLAAALNWRYIEFDIALIGSPAYAVDKWKTTEWIKDVVDYGKERGVRIYGWDEYKNLDTPGKRKDIFTRYNALGIAGCKVDFVNSYSQQTRKTIEDIIVDAMNYKLMLSFHGAQGPRGFARTYPHVMTFEAVKGAEYYLEINGGKGFPPSHNCTLPFSRNVLGSMDYTPVAFSSNVRTTTMAHELALSVIFESGWQGMCDVPEAYLNSSAREFLSQIHASWDETKFLGGYPGEYCVLARRKGEDWFIAGINAEGFRNISLDLSFLKPGNKTVELYTDNEFKENKLIQKTIIISNNEQLDLSMLNNGGFAFIVKNTD